MSFFVRHSEPRDIDAIRQIYAQPSTMAATLQLPFPSLERWQQRLQFPQPSFFSLVAEEEGAIVVQIGIEVMTAARRRHVASLGLGVSEAARGRGVGSLLLSSAIELCEGWLGIRRIELETFTDNAAAIALFKKQGFVIEGTAKGYALRAGAWADVYRMARCTPGP
jgi:putative acetyltransferase